MRRAAAVLRSVSSHAALLFHCQRGVHVGRVPNQGRCSGGRLRAARGGELSPWLRGAVEPGVLTETMPPWQVGMASITDDAHIDDGALKGFNAKKVRSSSQSPSATSLTRQLAVRSGHWRCAARSRSTTTTRRATRTPTRAPSRKLATWSWSRCRRASRTWASQTRQAGRSASVLALCYNPLAQRHLGSHHVHHEAICVARVCKPAPGLPAGRARRGETVTAPPSMTLASIPSLLPSAGPRCPGAADSVPEHGAHPSPRAASTSSCTFQGNGRRQRRRGLP